MEEQTVVSESEPESTSRILGSTAIQTAYFAVVLLALLCTVIVFVSPFASMRFYVNIGNRHRALESAESYIKLHAEENPQYDGRYAGVVYRAAQLAGDLFLSSETGVRKDMYAEKTVDLTDRYFAIENVSLKNQEIDAFQIANTPNAALHPSLYSIADYMTVTAYQANLYLGRRTVNDLIWLNRDRSIEDFRFEGILNGAHANTDLAATLNNTSELMAWMTVFNQLNAYIDTKFEEIGVFDLPDRYESTLGTFAQTVEGNPFDLFFTHGSGGFTSLYTQLTDMFRIFSGYVAAMPNNAADEALLQCYCVRAVSGFATRMADLTIIIRAQMHDETESAVLSQAAETWRENDVDPNGIHGAMSDWYRNALLPRYITLRSAT